MNTSKQVRKVPNPTGKGGFQERPQDRSMGHWDSKNTFSFQMNRFKNMTIQELEDWNKDTPKNIRTVAEDLAFKRVFNAQAKLDEFREVADRTEGKAQQRIKHEGGMNLSINRIADDIQKLILDDSEEENNSSEEISSESVQR